MASTALGSVLHDLRRSVGRVEGAGLTDGELLECFVTRSDEGAFEALLRRHAPMVLGVCRRILKNEADAEDAFQATFLVLVRKAASIRPRGLVGNWLYGVANTTALKARATITKRLTKEREAVRPQAQPDPWQQLEEILDPELRGLPDRYRSVIVLCDLEGKSMKEAARQLGCPVGTVSTRLARGRRLLARRLALRGLTLSGGAVGTALLANAATATAPPRLGRSTVEAAVVVAAGKAALGANVALLVKQVMTAMLLTNLRFWAAILLGLVAGFGVTLAGLPRHAQSVRHLAGEPRTTAKEGKAGDPDTDGDGLSDFHETHKYLTDPEKKDTAGNGASDGDWRQRREFAYSVRAVIRVMPPYNLKALDDDYQDVRVKKETKEYVDLEVVVYPFNTNAAAIQGNPNWKKDYAGMKEFLAPGVTTNWDDAMRRDLLRELAADGIDPDKLTDKEVVEQVSRWLFKRSRHRSMFCTFYVGFPGGNPRVLGGMEKAFDREKGDPKWTVQEQFDHELFGKQMFARKTYGTCTSTAVYQTTVLRALGIPTRMILCIPPADGSDPAQVEMVGKGLTNNRVRHDVTLGVLSGAGFTSHTFCEAFVGGRWRRLDSTTLGKNVLSPNYLGLMVKVHEFRDLSEAKLAETWGTRYAKGQRDANFPYNNPYRLLEVSDHFGRYAKVPNPPAANELKQVTITKAYWPVKDAPAEIRKMEERRALEEGPLRELVALGQDRRFYVHCHEWLENAGDYLQYKLFMLRADRNFTLRAKGLPDVSCQVSTSFYTHRSRNLCELEVVIPPSQYAKMAQGVAYTLHPANGKKGYEWKVREGVTLKRE